MSDTNHVFIATAARDPSEAPEEPNDPPWLSDTWAQVRSKAQPYLKTFVGFSFRPGLAVEKWLQDHASVMTPLGFMTASAAILGLSAGLLGDFVQGTKATAFEKVIGALGPYVYYGAVGFLFHLGSRLLGSSRRWTSTVGVALFVGGGMPALASLLTCGCLLFAHLALKIPLASEMNASHFPTWFNTVFVGVIGTPLLWFFVAMAKAMSSLHRINFLYTSVLSFSLLCATNYVSSHIELPVPHLAHSIDRTETGWSFRFHVNVSFSG